MADETVSQFPVALRGYDRKPVDEFVAQVARRLEELQSHLETQTARSDRMVARLDAANRDLEAFIEKETAISRALVTAEQARLQVEREVELQRIAAKLERDAELSDARREADEIIARAESEAAAIVAAAHADCIAEESRVRALRVEYDRTVTEIRRSLETQYAMLPFNAPPVSGFPVAGLAVTSPTEPNRDADKPAG